MKGQSEEAAISATAGVQGRKASSVASDENDQVEGGCCRCP